MVIKKDRFWNVLCKIIKKCFLVKDIIFMYIFVVCKYFKCIYKY